MGGVFKRVFKKTKTKNVTTDEGAKSDPNFETRDIPVRRRASAVCFAVHISYESRFDSKTSRAWSGSTVRPTVNTTTIPQDRSRPLRADRDGISWVAHQLAPGRRIETS